MNSTKKQHKLRARVALFGLATAIFGAAVYMRWREDIALVVERLMPNNKAVFSISEPLNSLRYGKKVGEAYIDITGDGVPDHIIQRGQRGEYSGLVMFKDGKDKGFFGTYREWYISPFVFKILKAGERVHYFGQQDFPLEEMYGIKNRCEKK